MSVQHDQARAHTLRRLRQRALSLGGANAFDYITQFLLPVVLARFLDTLGFGQYRLLWLATRTALSIAPLAMPASLYYFLPRSDGADRRLYVNQTLFFLAVTGLLSGWAVSSWNPWLPQSMQALEQHGAMVPVFVALWILASLLDMLPAIEERVSWQTWAIIGLAVLRTVALSVAAIVTGELGAVLLVMIAFVVFKLALLGIYIAKYHGLRRPIVRWKAFVQQMKHATPFGAAGALYDLRAQADQWIAATLFSLHLFAAFSVGAVIGTLVSIFRKSVNTAFLPGMSRLEAAGDLHGMLELNSRANAMVGALVCPLAAFAFVYAEEVVTLIYTEAYISAAPVMRVYIIGLLALIVELASITLLLRQGPFVVRVNIAALVIAIPVSWLAARHYGLAGAAAGSVIAIYLDRLVTLKHISRLSGVPLRRLQDWNALGTLLVYSMLSAALAWWVTASYFPEPAPFIRLVVGGSTLGAAYLLLLNIGNVMNGLAVAGKR